MNPATGTNNRPATRPSFLRAAGAIAWKDLVAELHSHEMLSGMLVFALLILLIFNYAIDLAPELRPAVTPG